MKIMRFSVLESPHFLRESVKMVKMGQNGSNMVKVVNMAKLVNKSRNANFAKSVLTAVMSKGEVSEMHFLHFSGF